MEEAIFNEDKLWRQIEEVISRIISQYMEMESVNLMPVNMADLKRKLFANFVSIILLSNEDITIYVRTYYNYRDLKHIIPGSLGDISREFSENYMKEYANTLGGKIASAFEQGNVSLLRSFPLITSSFSEYFFRREESEYEISRIWKITENERDIYCKIDMFITDMSVMETLNKINISKSNEEIDFL